MTTIAYKDGWMVGDMLSVRHDSGVGTNQRKVWKSDGHLMGGAGGYAQLIEARDWFLDGMEGDPPVSDGTAFMIVGPDNPEQVFVFDGKIPFIEKAPFALGIGRDYALGAMAAGADAIEAVGIASDYCIRTGGELTIERLDWNN